MIHLFTDTNREEWTDIAQKYDIDISNVLQPFIEKAKKEGHSLRDLNYVINAVVDELILAALLDWDEPQE